MEITGVEPIPLESAVGTFSFAGGRSEFDATVRPVLVRVETDTGHVGLGESYLDDPTGEKAKFVAQGVRGLREHVVGEDPRNVRECWEEMYVHAKRSASYRSLSAIDEALWDLAGKAVGEPLYRLLGGQAGEVSAYATFPYQKEIDRLIEDGARLAEKGFETMKTVVGKDLEADHRRIREVRAGIPDDLGLAIDANTSFTHADARALGRTASEAGLEWFEEPIAHTDIEGQAELNRTLDVPVSGYQSHTPHYPAREHLEAGALEIYQPALDLCGGVTGGQAVATLVEAYNKQFVPHAFGPAINYAASLHVAAASPVCDLIEFAVYDDEIDDTGRFVASPYVANQDAIYVQDGGVIEPPEEPGLGLELDEDRLEEYRMD